jgi:hypothetical protein
LKPIHELTLPILGKTAGIFLKNLGSDGKTINFEWKNKHEDLLEFHVEEVPIVEAPGEVYFLINFFAKFQTISYLILDHIPQFSDILAGHLTNQEKHEILRYLTDLKLNETDLASIPPDNLLPVITLLYLIVQNSLKIHEAIGILQSLKQAPETVDYPERVDLRMLRVTSLVSSFSCFFKNCLVTIGLKERFVMNVDGVFCQNWIQNNPGPKDDEELGSEAQILKRLLEHV